MKLTEDQRYYWVGDNQIVAIRQYGNIGDIAVMSKHMHGDALCSRAIDIVRTLNAGRRALATKEEGDE